MGGRGPGNDPETKGGFSRAPRSPSDAGTIAGGEGKPE
jgi:hypothetical protein